MDFLSARGQQGDAPTAWYGVDIEVFSARVNPAFLA